MNVCSLKLAGAVASTLALSLVTVAANADTKFHKQLGTFSLTAANSATYTSKYTFQKSMILNSLAFYTNGETMSEMSYSLNAGGRLDLVPASTVDSNGFRWYEFSGGMSINAGTTLEVFTRSSDTTTHAILSPGPYNFTNQEIVWNGSRVVSEGSSFTTNFTNSNIGINVAPEPGSIALLLTGGGALAGIALRRRRNAA